MDCGVNGVAVVSAIMGSHDVRFATRRLRSLVCDRWSRHVWNRSSSTFCRILRHPFIQELALGVLDAGRFGRYIAQDELYLGNYGRQMFQLADMIGDEAQRDMFRMFAQSGLEGEKAMHELLIGRFGIKAVPEPSWVTVAYNAHTQAALDGGSKEEALAAMLPCMWIYSEVGLYILRIARMEENPYKEWIQEYGNEEFTEGVKTVVDLIDEWAQHVDEATRERMAQNYQEAAQFEYDFWDYGYKGQ